MALSIGASVALTEATAPSYSASIKAFISVTQTERDAGIAYQGGLFSQERAQSYADLATSRRVAHGVVDSLGLDMSPDTLRGKIQAQALPETVLMEVTVTDRWPRRAQQIADQVGSEMVQLIERLERPEGDRPALVRVTVVDPARLPAAPVTPQPARNVGLGLLAGVLLGVGAAVLRESLDRSVRRGEELAALTSAPALAMVGFDGKASKRPLVVHLPGHEPRAEAFRQLRTNLQFINVDRPSRRIVFTSAIAQEGKSTATCNLAITMAQAGQRVVLVEADLRRPKIHRYLGLEGAVGLTDVLIGRAGLDDVLQQWGNLPLKVLPSGSIPPNPSELVGSSRMEELLTLLEAEADVVLIDAPPLLPVTDAAVLARRCDGVVLVARYGKVRREQIHRAVQHLAGVDARLLGTLFNCVPTKGGDAYAYGYGYGYGYKPTATPTLPDGQLGTAGQQSQPLVNTVDGRPRD
ncbi:MAG: polysaccharide biosynthesis tyrosine autokinase [Carbonactinosporaceae bacterium]